MNYIKKVINNMDLSWFQILGSVFGGVLTLQYALFRSLEIFGSVKLIPIYIFGLIGFVIFNFMYGIFNNTLWFEIEESIRLSKIKTKLHFYITSIGLFIFSILSVYGIVMFLISVNRLSSILISVTFI